MTARRVASGVRPGAPVRWDQLEEAAFRCSSPGLGFRPRFGERKWKTAGVLIWAVPATIVYFACYLAPVWGFASVYDGHIASAAPPPDPETAIPRSGAFFMIGAGFMLISFGHWLMKRRPRDGFYQIQAALSLVLGPITALRVQRLASDEDVANWELWMLPGLAAAVLGAAFLIAHKAFGVARKPLMDPATGVPSGAAAELEKRRAQVSELSEEQRERMRFDLDAAVDDLERRKAISVADANHARNAELGGLAFHMRA